MRKILLSILALSMLLASTLVGCECSSSLTILSITEGEVFVMKAGTGNWVEAQAGMSLGPGDMIRTGHDSNALVTFFEGSTIELLAGTEIEVVALGVARDTGSTTVRLGQTIGRTIFRVTKIIDPASRYEVETPTGLVAVRGSAVEIYVIEDGTSLITNIAGDIRAIAQGVEVRIPEGAGAIIRPDEPPELTGVFLNEIVITREPSPAAAIQALNEDALDVYAHSLGDPALYAEVLADSNLTLVEAGGSCQEFTFNPVGPIFPATGKLNPFSVPEFREAMHWLIDRDHIANEIMGGLAVPRYTCLNSRFADARERYPDLMTAMETKYAHNLSKAAGIITTEMEKQGAVLEGGRWMYDGAPVELIFLIRTDDKRKDTGEYFAQLLEELGFEIVRLYSPSLQDSQQIWAYRDPAEGLFHVYTGGWGQMMISRNEGANFGAFYTDLWPDMGPLWQAYVNDPIFYEAAQRLWNTDYSSLEERAELFEICLPYSMQENQRMFLVTEKWFSPMRANVRLAHDLCAGVHGSWMWALTAHFVDDDGYPIVGGTLRIAMPDILTGSWNPLGGSGFTWPFYDRFAILATGDMGHWPDTRTGLRRPGRFDSAEVFVQSGLPVGVTNTEWYTLTVVPQIQVPLDAWADWDAVNQRFLTVNDRFGSGGTTALSKSVSYYPKEIFEVPLHDGSTLSTGDFILYTILQFDRAKPDSAIYDDSAVGAYNSLMGHFKGVKFITDDPDYGLIVEYYSDWWQLDAELMVTTMFPFYSQGPGMWHTIALGIRAEQDRALAFSQAKSNALGVAWANFIDGPSLSILEGYLDTAKASSYIPYEPTMRLYVTEAEAAERWSNLEEWYAEKGHIWVGSGPFYLESVDTTQKIIHLKRFQDYPDPMDRWLFLLEPLP